MAGKRYGIAEAQADILARGAQAVQRTLAGANNLMGLVGGAQAATNEARGAPLREFVFGGAERNSGPYVSRLPQAPSGVSVEADLAEVAKHKGDPAALLWWINKVKDHGDWDYKRRDPKYEDFGNYDYGATGSALGIPPGILLRGAGAVQMRNGLMSGKWRPEWGFRLAPAHTGTSPGINPSSSTV